MTKDNEVIKWYLCELANADPDGIESNDIDIYGEDEEGREGCNTAQITDIADKALKRIAELEKQVKWVSVDDELPDENTKVWFWLVLKPVEERHHDSSGNPIPSSDVVYKPYKHVCKWNCWSSVMKPTHWKPLPSPPKE